MQNSVFRNIDRAGVKFQNRQTQNLRLYMQNSVFCRIDSAVAKFQAVVSLSVQYIVAIWFVCRICQYVGMSVCQYVGLSIAGMSITQRVPELLKAGAAGTCRSRFLFYSIIVPFANRFAHNQIFMNGFLISKKPFCVK